MDGAWQDWMARWVARCRNLWMLRSRQAWPRQHLPGPHTKELFNADQMERHGYVLAGLHRLAKARGGDRLLAELAINEQALVNTCQVLTAAVRASRQIAPAGEWLLDNFYLIQEQVRTARRHLPKGYSRTLPRLADGESAGLPRAYDIALEAVAHGDGRIDAEGLARFVRAYQQRVPLDLGELWAIPIMLRLALIDNLRRLAEQVAESTAAKDRADRWADWMMGVAERDPKSLILVVADMARSDPPMATSFVAELVRRLQGQSAALALPLTWIEQRLGENGLTIEHLVQLESQKQAACQLSISNSIGSLRLFGALDWRDFVENLSVVEHTLLQDPEDIYRQMDFATRDRYRHEVELLARRTGLSEPAVAAHCLALAQEAATHGLSVINPADRGRLGHVGEYLIGAGRHYLAARLNLRPAWWQVPFQLAGRWPLPSYALSIVGCTLLIAWPWMHLLDQQAQPLALACLLGVLLLFASNHLAIAVVNWLATLVARPQVLPRMDYADGIPAEACTVVVVPAMLISVSAIDAMCEALEVRFLANRDPQLRFALLTDPLDAAEQVLPGDQVLLDRASAAIELLNLRYPAAEGDLFFLLHRARQWNAAEGCWLAPERKRGKLAALNGLLQGGSPEAFSHVCGRLTGLRNVRYVITLDVDTRLPRDAARHLIGAMAHPLNRPSFDAQLGRVTSGYGILQPRVAISLPSTQRSGYARIFGNDCGIDPYTRAVSDVYQDLFGEGSFIGKGIYEVETFEHALSGQLPDNRVLSHDLLEGCYARAGLLSDSLLVEDCPSRYADDVLRRHRWIRGDWQIASWMLGWVPFGSAQAPVHSVRNPLSPLSRWKIADNLRRSLVAPLLTTLLVLSWWLLKTPAAWTALVLVVLFVPALIATVIDLCRKPEDLQLGLHFSATMRTGRDRVVQVLFSLACLLHEALYCLDAILRTQWRVLVSHRHLLQWQASLLAQDSLPAGVSGTPERMWPVSVVALLLLVGLAGLHASALLVAAPVLLLWSLAPLVAAWFSRPRQAREVDLDARQWRFLGGIGRRTWRFFERYVGADDQWLPPDNFQEYPVRVVAHRTSPTNIGLALLANLAAHDLGYLSTGNVLVRTAATFASLARLERYRGHFYNWYDTRSLQPLLPLYVSTVDSGNLSAHLITLQAGLLELGKLQLLGGRCHAGLMDTLHVLEQSLAAFAQPAAFNLMPLTEALAGWQAVPAGQGAAQVFGGLLNLQMAAQTLLSTVHADDGELVPDEDGPRVWIQLLLAQAQDALAELTLLAPWADPRTVPPGEWLWLEFVPLPTLAAVASGDPAGLARRIANRAVRATPGAAAVETAAVATAASAAWLQTALAASQLAAAAARGRLAESQRLATQAHDFAQADYGFLYDSTRRLLVIGFNVAERRCDASYYDMFASEARLASFVAIAEGQLPQSHWFAMGRLLTRTGGTAALLSWSGSMFEYLMPLLVMPNYGETLLDRTYRSSVERQIEYGRQRDVPWGISESGYNMVDAALNYQYRAFGVPGLGLKPGLAEDLVIAPYASALALMVAPAAACRNLQRLATEGATGTYGFYEAVDYTPARVPRRQSSALVRSFMAHHQGMILLSLDYLIGGQPMQRRFCADPMIQATVLLLQEKIPRIGVFRFDGDEVTPVRPLATDQATPGRRIDSPWTVLPVVQLLSNGHYHVMVTNAGGGYSRWHDLAVTRWQEDPTADGCGTFCYLRDTASGTVWSNTHHPTRRPTGRYEAIFAEGRAEFRRSDLDYEVYTELVVSPEDDIELRRVHITNNARVQREIEVTTYAEVVLAPPMEDAVHPAFSNLFVQTERLADRPALLCTRRPRSDSEAVAWMLHLLAVRGDCGQVSVETDRARFIGRTRSTRNPAALEDGAVLSDTVGSVLDPVVAIRTRITLDPQQSIIVDIVTGVTLTRDAAVGLVNKYLDRHLADRVFDLAWTHSQVALRQINVTESDAQRYARIAASVLFADMGLRADPAILARNRRSQSGLWGYAISGDLPVVLVQISDPAGIELVRQMVQAHAYWRLKGLAADLVIWNEDQAGYRQMLQEQILGLIAAGAEAHVVDKPGGIFVRRSEQMSEDERTLVQAVARVMVCDRRGTLAEQVDGRLPGDARSLFTGLPRFRVTRAHLPVTLAEQPNPLSREVPRQGQRGMEHGHSTVFGLDGRAGADGAGLSKDKGLQFPNPWGGFSADGREYVTHLQPGQPTPAPWCNVIANAGFGTVISESGMACTWSENAQQFRLTPWNNDPVSDGGGEVIYLRDEESGHFWSATALPCPGQGAYTTRHGFGYSCFEHVEDGIASILTVFVALEGAVKFSLLQLENHSGRPRRISATCYVEWVLGDLRPKTAMHVVTELALPSRALTARNAYNNDFTGRLAFLDCSDPVRTVTGDRAEFLGRNRTLAQPSAMGRARLSNVVGAALDPCGAMQVMVDLPAEASHEWVFRLGCGVDSADMAAQMDRTRGRMVAHEALAAVKDYWRITLGAVQVHTPDAALDVLVNGWLLYQTLACRLWGRAGFYQSGGAFGFRDQLQDVMALLHAEPGLARAHLLRCAERQFREGDVQHWWHANSGRGVRTRCSDDYLWLPFVVCRYVQVTGDRSVLDEMRNFLDGRAVAIGEDAYFDLPLVGEERATLYQHCVRAIRHGLRFGAHGLPLMGSGDWNDGMNMVGIQGRGESVWLGFFLYRVLEDFAGLADAQLDAPFAAECRAAALTLQEKIELAGWDGDWYRRAYYDDGTALGTRDASECRIDAVAQSWSVLSGAARPERAQAAMAALSRWLVRPDDRLIALLDPPFDHGAENPGYIRGYVPGVRENGGQYTHAAVWSVMALAQLGDHEGAWALMRMINPVRHGDSGQHEGIYKVEPYVVAADVYAVAPHTGRGGWTWYTGSAGWFYRLLLESLLGVQRAAGALAFRPCLPAGWSGFTLDYRHASATYAVTVAQVAGRPAGPVVWLDGVLQAEAWLTLQDDGQLHQVRVELGLALPALSMPLPSVAPAPVLL